MGLYNQFGVFLIGINLLIPSLAQALTLEPVKIDSSQGEPLYAEIPFFNAESSTPIQVSIAQPFEYGRPEVFKDAQFSHFNFYVRQNAQGNGVIVITSSRPVQDSNIDLMLKIQDGSQTRVQQMRTKLPSRIDRLQSSLNATPLKPQFIRNEKEIPLNLPVARSIQTMPQERPLTVQRTAPPNLVNKTPFSVPRLDTPKPEVLAVTQQLAPEKASPVAPILTVTAPPAMAVSQAQSTPSIISATPSSITAQPPQQPHNKITATPDMTAALPLPNLTISISRRSATGELLGTTTSGELTSSTLQAQNTVQHNENTFSTADTTATPTHNSHQVQVNESLWGIAASIAAQQHVSIQHVMKDIKTQNPHAFVNGNANRLKQGVVLNISPSYPPTQKPLKVAVPTQKNPPTNTKVSPTPLQQPSVHKQTDAHMSIVTNNKGAIQGSDKSSDGQKQRNELTIQVKQQRQNALGLQNNVRQLDQQLKQKERRIALLNARLAELEQQLKLRQNEQKKSQNSSNNTSKSQGHVPALMPNTPIIVLAEFPTNTVITSLLQELV